MLKIDDAASISFSNMGLFVGEGMWSHPEIRTATHELIFVVKGSVFIEENGIKYSLSAGDMLLLSPEYVHRGYQQSLSPEFYWLHFYGDGCERFAPKRQRVSDAYSCVAFFSQPNHLAKACPDKARVECMLAAFLLEKKYAAAEKNKLFHDVGEYIRVNIASAPKVRGVAERFGYNPDYLSRLFYKNCGLSLKKFIDVKRMEYLESMLGSTTLTLKEIAALSSFDDENALIRFFTDRSGCSPTRFRNRCYESHTNRA